MMMNAVSDHLSVSLRGEAVAQTFELGAQHLVIFDNPVVHDRDAVAGRMGVRIVCGRDPVGCPSGMRNTHGAAYGGGRERILQNLHLSDRAQAGYSAGLEYGDTG